jgi:hypothetical protein
MFTFQTYTSGADEEEFEFVRQMQNNSLSFSEERKTRTIPSVVKWDGGGQSVFVTFDDGATKIPMVKRFVLAHSY